MLKLAAFADEISPDLEEQIAVCKANGITHFELRSVENINVLNLDPAMRRRIRERLRENALGVICIGSPIGKAKITDAWDEHFERFRIAVDLAEYFEAPLLRVFSYYPPDEKTDIRQFRDEVLRRMQAKVDYVRGRPVTLVHENEKGIYGEKAAECLDLMRSIDSPRLRAAFDFANFIQAGECPLENWGMLQNYVAHMHVKDALKGSGRIVAAGLGDGQIRAILADAYGSGYGGFLSLEPHLRVAGHSHGETGAALFKEAADALKSIYRELRVNEGPGRGD